MSLSSLVLVAGALLSAPSSSPLDAYAGVWETNLGRLELDVIGDRVYGRNRGLLFLSSADECRLWGGLEGEKLVLDFEEEQTGPGTAVFELGEDGGLVGQWTANDSTFGSGPWTAKPILDELPSSGFAGLWETNYGRVRLMGSAAELVGCYESTVSNSLRGVADGNVFRFTYVEGETEGVGEFQLSQDGATVAGFWLEEGSDRRVPWSGQRAKPVPEVVWLVVLEAHWEENLRQREFAFGDMLRGYFGMDSGKHVRVRQRYFHDAEDFHRFAHEVHFLAEPTVVLVASHGVPDGIAVNDSIIGPGLMAKSLFAAEQVELLHLSGCSLMGGDFPSSLHAALGPASRMVISGYTTEVDWDASAIADFVFLSMLLLRGLDPHQALEQAHRAAPFTGPPAPPGLPALEEPTAPVFQPLGLTLRDPR